MREGAQVALLDGDEDLEVVGESFYQDNLWQLAGARPGEQRVREDIYSVLVAKEDNPYDPNTVAVWISGLKVGHLSRENAQRYRPGLLAQQDARGMPITLAGVITGGGIRSDGNGDLQAGDQPHEVQREVQQRPLTAASQRERLLQVKLLDKHRAGLGAQKLCKRHDEPGIGAG